jgi:hypothetical protein
MEEHLEPAGPDRVHDPVDRTGYPTRISRLGDPEDDSYVRSLTPAERMAMVWPLTLQAWEFKEGFDHEPRLQRHVVRVVRGRG